MDAAKSSLNRFLLDPANHDILTLIKATRNGIVYGAKVRFPHALVMILLFRTAPLPTKALAVLKATRTHALTLASFAFLYKLLTLLLRSLPPLTSTSTSTTRLSTRKESSSDSFLSGLLAGYLVFGRRARASSSVNQQIVIYVFARVCLALAKLSVAPRTPRAAALQAGYGHVGPGGPGVFDAVLKVLGVGEERGEWVKRVVGRNSWAVFASVSWGAVMWLFRWHPEELQPSLRSSMRYLYDNAERWDGWRNFLWYNQ